MSDVIDRTHEEGVPAHRAAEASRTPRWTRATTIWCLIILSLAAGGAIGLFRNEWQQVPPGVQWAVYLMLAMLVIAACGLILTQPDQHASEQPPASNDS